MEENNFITPYQYTVFVDKFSEYLVLKGEKIEAPIRNGFSFISDVKLTKKEAEEYVKGTQHIKEIKGDFKNEVTQISEEEHIEIIKKLRDIQDIINTILSK